MSTIIDITKIISQDLKSRSSVDDLLLYIKNSAVHDITFDFSNVKFATRSFIDEYYNKIMLNKTSGLNINTINIPEDIQFIFQTVKNTQKKKKDINLNASIIKCSTFKELQKAFNTLSL